MATIIKHKTNEDFFHELQYFEPDDLTPIDITNIDIWVKIEDENGVEIASYENVGNVAAGIIKTEATSGKYTIETAKETAKLWPIGNHYADISYKDVKHVSTDDFILKVSKGRANV